LTPGSDAGIGFSDLIKNALPARLAGANNFSDLAGALTGTGISLGSGRTANIAATGTTTAGTDQLAVTMDVTRSVTGVGVSLSSQSPHIVFGSTDGVAVGLTLHAAFTFGYDTATRYLYLVKDNTSPVLSLDATASIPDLTKVHASIGILGVSLATGSTFTLSTNLAATFNDPNGDGKLALRTADTALAEPDGAGGTKPGELNLNSGSIASIVNVGFGTPPGAVNANLIITGTGTGPAYPRARPASPFPLGPQPRADTATPGAAAAPRL